MSVLVITDASLNVVILLAATSASVLPDMCCKPTRRRARVSLRYVTSLTVCLMHWQWLLEMSWDTIWHVVSRIGDLRLWTAVSDLLTYLLTCVWKMGVKHYLITLLPHCKQSIDPLDWCFRGQWLTQYVSCSKRRMLYWQRWMSAVVRHWSSWSLLLSLYGRLRIVRWPEIVSGFVAFCFVFTIKILTAYSESAVDWRSVHFSLLLNRIIITVCTVVQTVVRVVRKSLGNGAFWGTATKKPLNRPTHNLAETIISGRTLNTPNGISIG